MQTEVLILSIPLPLDMGFGSYDESEQQDQNVDASEDEAVNVHESGFEGDVKFETGASTDELMNQLEDIKEEAEEDEAD
jgi:hypothetical protein